MLRKILQSFVGGATSTQHEVVHFAGCWKSDDRTRRWQSYAEAPYRSALLYLSAALEPVPVGRQHRQYRFPAHLSTNISNLKYVQTDYYSCVLLKYTHTFFLLEKKVLYPWWKLQEVPVVVRVRYNNGVQVVILFRVINSQIVQYQVHQIHPLHLQTPNKFLPVIAH